MSRDLSGYTDYLFPSKDQIPELMFLGSLSTEELIYSNGKCVEYQVITLEGKKYVMKQRKLERWFDER
jgi:hypothetical protein